MGPSELSILWSPLPSMAVLSSYTSEIPQDEVGNALALYAT